MTQRWVSLAESADLLEPAYAFSTDDEAGAAFMGHDLAGSLATAKRIAKLWPEFLLVLVLSDGTVAARAVAVPFDSSSADRARLPDTGWDGVVQWAIADVLDGREPTAACALEIAIDPAHRGRGISSSAIAALREVVARRGWNDLVAPVRPPDKANDPFTAMHEYAFRKRADGLPADRWLRVHARAGGVVVGIATSSMVVTGSIDQWREWTGLPFRSDGLVAVPGGLVPVLVSQVLRVGAYVEPNVWMRHLTRP